MTYFLPLALGTVLLAIAIYRCIIEPLYTSPLSKIPGPRAYALTRWRLAWDEYRGHRTRAVHELHARYGPVVRIGPNEVHFNTPSALHTIYGAGSGFGRTDFYRMFDAYGKQNVFTFGPSSQHAERKRLLASAYAKGSVIKGRVAEEVERKVEDYLKLVEDTGERGDEIFRSLHYFSLDNITNFLYGPHYGGTMAMQGDRGHQALLDDILDPDRRKLTWCVVHFPSLVKWLYSRTGWIERLVAPFLPMQKPSTYTRIRAHALTSMQDYKEAVEQGQVSAETKDSVIDRLWTHHQDRKKGGLDDLDVAAECSDHLLAGIDTTADTLMFLLWALSRPENRKYQDKVIEEARHIPETGLNESSNPTVEAADKLPYLDAVIKETLRLYAPLPASEPRSPPKATMIDGYYVPAGTAVSMAPYSLHRNPDIFPDPLKWDPERWLTDDTARLMEMKKWWWAFSSGGRMCIGMHLAMAEMVALVPAIYRLYETSIKEGFEGVTPGITSRFEVFYDERIEKMEHVASREGNAGSEIIVRYAETAKADGTVLMPDQLFKAFETEVYSTIYLAGTGSPEVWQPYFCFTSARYIQLEGVALQAGKGLPVVHSVVGQHVSSASRGLGGISTDQEDCNQLINACKWTYSSNLFSYQTDCPQIEKFGWLEVTHLLAAATHYFRDVEALYTKIIDDICDAHESNGLIPTMTPEMRYMCGPLHDTITWGCALCFLPEILKRYYGSTHVIRKVYPHARRYMEYMKTKERKGGLIEHGLGDWGRQVAFGNHQALIETAIYFKCLRSCQMMADELQLDRDSQFFSREAQRSKEVYNQHLLVTDDPERGAYHTSLDNYPSKDCTAVGQGVALQFGMVPGQHIQSVQQAFLADVADGKMRAGEIGLPFLFNTLGELRRPDIILQMARQEERPSYMRFLRRGETTLLEFWQDSCRSKCHDMLGTIYELFYAHVLGLRPTSDAYRSFIVDPPFESEFGEVRGTVDCPYGEINMHWKYQEDAEKTNNFMLLLEVPFGSTAKVCLPSKLANIQLAGWDGETRSVTGTEAELVHGTYRFFVERVIAESWAEPQCSHFQHICK